MRKGTPRAPAGPGSRPTPDIADLITVGEVTRPSGVQGAVRVVPVTDFPDHLLTLREVTLVRGQTGRPARVQRAERAGRFVVMKFAGIDTPEEARALQGATLRIPPEEAYPLPPGQYYIFQIVGLRVRTPDGRILGEVVEVLRTGTHDVYAVRPPEGPVILLPAHSGVIERIDLAAGEIIARPPEWA
jgi:16S rRNA processing protein RimM